MNIKEIKKEKMKIKLKAFLILFSSFLILFSSSLCVEKEKSGEGLVSVEGNSKKRNVLTTLSNKSDNNKERKECVGPTPGEGGYKGWRK